MGLFREQLNKNISLSPDNAVANSQSENNNNNNVSFKSADDIAQVQGPAGSDRSHPRSPARPSTAPNKKHVETDELPSWRKPNPLSKIRNKPLAFAAEPENNTLPNDQMPDIKRPQTTSLLPLNASTNRGASSPSPERDKGVTATTAQNATVSDKITFRYQLKTVIVE